MFGDSTKSSKEDHQPRDKKDQSDAVIDPALRSLASSPSSDKKRHKGDTSLVNQPTQDQPSSMPLRVDQLQMSSSPFVPLAFCLDTPLFNDVYDRRRHHFDTSSHSHRPPSPPPPITTMSSNSHSPSPSVVSVDRSSNSTPHIRRSPPQHSMQPAAMYSTYSQHDPPVIQSARHHYPSPREPINHGQYIYASHPPFDPQPRYDQHQHPDTRQPYPLPAHFAVAPMSHPQQNMHDYSRQYPIPGQPPVTIVHTDDAATKLTDGIRRRCFNCCTTDTSTWRRSNLSPGKVLCNKCGLFERTHSRPRPDQFPHKRGPLSGQNLRGRTPPGSSSSNQLPPISSGAPYHQYHHQAITPVNTAEYHPSTTLPGLQTWHGNNSSTSSSNGNVSSSGHSSASNGGSNSHTITGPGGTTTSGGGGGGASGSGSDHSNPHSTSNSATGTPLLTHRRPTLESPRLQATHAHASPRGRPFDEPLTSNNAADSHHAPSPPSTISRSNTGPSSVKQESGSVSHTPSPAA
ncbi:hypothetical protein GALMADRAFT_148160 [Galerina marginata CBS 339.88]|uniref:GATA-type domain-containing protein n=1 Tax=Galerina marginata (strain CBS 339.88) TaxID=685588 RepID=A0A067SEG3_GALM3|nr:hypothetical protein GALMADRAFT_148160 [Galerina marginata CBS 339.88]